MANTQGKVNLVTITVSKNDIDETTMLELLSVDNDFDGTDEGIQISKQAFENNQDKKDEEYAMLKSMVEETIDETEGFIGMSSYYGDYEYRVLEHEFEYTIVVTYIS
jgi:hypothetical protein